MRHHTFVELDFEQVVNSYYESLYRFALSLARNEAEAADLTQDTFYTFASKGHQVRGKEENQNVAVHDVASKVPWHAETRHSVFRVLKGGGRAVISDIVSDEDVPETLQNDPNFGAAAFLAH